MIKVELSPRAIKRGLALLLSLFLGFFFVYSAYTKIPTLEQFGWRITETTFLNWWVAEWIARLIIGIEFFIGILFIFHLRLKRLAIPLSLTMLGVFSAYLLYIIFIRKENIDCGCMGEVIPMTPLQALIKNAVLVGLILWVRSIRTSWTFNYIKPVLWGTLLVCVLTPFFVVPPESIYLTDPEPELKKPISLSLLYPSNHQHPSEELRQGKHILLFLSLSCTYCKKAAQRMRIMKSKKPELPFFAILNGDERNLKSFIEETRMDNIPYFLFNGSEQFLKLNGGFTLPSIKWVEDTTVVRESNYISLKEIDIQRWLKTE